MYYRLNEAVALRRWKQTGYAYYVKGSPFAGKLTEPEFELLRLCNGEEDLTDSEMLADLVKRNLIRPCAFGEHSSEWSRFRRYDNRYFPRMNLMITGKCNYNCMHCFNAADNAPLMSEWDFADICSLLDQAADCGIHAVTITGGEPMVHPRFMDILREIHRRELFVEELNTNGYFITREMLETMKSFGCRPLLKISFDGLGFHDWMRSRKGAEARTLSAIKLCLEEGFRVKVQTQVNKKNRMSLMPTARLLNDMGVESMRLIRTTEVPRWQKNAGDAGMSIEEYYEAMLDFCGDYARSGLQMRIAVWQLMKLYPDRKQYHLQPVLCGEGEFRFTMPVCRDTRKMIAVTSEKEVVPCLQSSGYLKNAGVSLGNLGRQRLKEILNDSLYEETVCSVRSAGLRNCMAMTGSGGRSEGLPTGCPNCAFSLQEAGCSGKPFPARNIRFPVRYTG